ncbi:hypothetical protein AJ80_02230 [Polytolypa hystricis UAMH7299]|uniref:Aminoglycoside phosphotransferase domain-containing protein n=1 Tax=Polytolypa hystricis (strain UAMH7299) TaxID=1447883 RepID=A0A2B7YHQ7_POLH7|nr:hypothetical protein AJ80_02230 [Polytolypa hystricis UAMH7299]
MDPFTPKAGYGQDIGYSLTGVINVMSLDEHRVLKSKEHSRQEADALQFVASNTTIPVPKVYDVDDEGQNIVIEYMPGNPLDKVWIKLTHDQRDSVCHQLAGYLAQLRQLTGKQIEAPNGGRVRVGYYQTRWDGPFKTEKEFNHFLAQGTGLCPGESHKIHFAHGDLSPRNVLVDESGCVTAVLDWEWAGFFPEYWDVARMLLDTPEKKKVPDYKKHLLSALTALTNKYEEELKVMRKVAGLDTIGPGPGKPVHVVPSSS